MTDSPAHLGPNSWLADEMYETYRANPAAVSAEWRAFFESGGDQLGAADDAPSIGAPANGAPPTPSSNGNGWPAPLGNGSRHHRQ